MNCSSLAGCDDLDSDGNGIRDECEDRFAPELVVRNAEIFRCDEDDTRRLCYDGNVFKNEKQLKNFLEYQFPATDDCSSTNKLDVKIEYESGSCRNTVYTLTPLQNISSCNDHVPKPVGAFAPIAFKNPLYGTSKNVTVQLDDEAPVIECGFHHPDSTSLNKVDGKTLYHYMTKSEQRDGGDGFRLNDARFFYTVTVSTFIVRFFSKHSL